jgi:hypothetical protein
MTNASGTERSILPRTALTLTLLLAGVSAAAATPPPVIIVQPAPSVQFQQTVQQQQTRDQLQKSQLQQQGTELEFVIMVIAVSCVKLLSAHNSTQHTSRKHKV